MSGLIDVLSILVIVFVLTGLFGQLLTWLADGLPLECRHEWHEIGTTVVDPGHDCTVLVHFCCVYCGLRQTL